MSWIISNDLLYIIMQLQMGHVLCENQWLHKVQCMLFLNKQGTVIFGKPWRLEVHHDQQLQAFTIYSLLTSSNSALVGAARSVWMTFHVPCLCLCWEKGLTVCKMIMYSKNCGLFCLLEKSSVLAFHQSNGQYETKLNIKKHPVTVGCHHREGLSRFVILGRAGNKEL